MARVPKPWYWKERKGYYVTINGVRHPLGENEAKAKKEFHRIMATGGQLEEREKEKIKVGDAVEAMLASVQHCRPNTRRLYLYNLEPFAAEFEKRRLDSVTHEEILKFISAYQGKQYNNRTFGDPTRAMLFKFVKILYKWAKDSGLTQTNHMHGKTCPWKSLPRERVMNEAEYNTVMQCGVNAKFKEVLEILWRTGARPGEIATVQARHLHTHLPIIVLQPAEHKTGTKTGLQRQIHVPADIMAKLRALAVDRPRGELLRRMSGEPWDQPAISGTYGYWKRKLGMADDCVIYLARHAFGTRALEKGHSIAMVAKMMGHNDPGTLMKHYFHPDQVAMVDAVDKL